MIHIKYDLLISLATFSSPQSHLYYTTQIYRGPSTSQRIAGLEACSEYRVRVCAVRQTKSRFELHGAFSQVAVFVTAPLKASVRKDVEAGRKSEVPCRWWVASVSDQQWALLLLLCFAFFAILVAVLAQQLIYDSPDEASHHPSTSNPFGTPSTTPPTPNTTKSLSTFVH